MHLDQFNSIELGMLAEINLGLMVMQLLLFLSSIFLMLLILVQRGKGGGLTGALGGMGGQSAFGSKAGDAFTKITIITAVIWIMLCMLTIAGFNPPPPPQQTVNNDAEISAGMSGDEAAPLDSAADGDGLISEESSGEFTEGAVEGAVEVEGEVDETPQTPDPAGNGDSDNGAEGN